MLTELTERGVRVDALSGTSSGALVGALFAAGVPPADIARELSARRPISWMTPSITPWRGLFRLDRVVKYLRDVLPPEFSGLERPFAVGVRTPEGGHRYLSDGPLAEAVAASCAIPGIFEPVTGYADGGMVDRLGLKAWRAWRPNAERAIVHWVEKTRSAGDLPPTGNERYIVVQTPRSGASFFSLKDFDGQVRVARERTASALADYPG